MRATGGAAGGLAKRAAEATLAFGAGAILLVLAASSLRLLPALLHDATPARAATTLLLATLRAAAETACFVAPPAGFALAAASMVARGELRTLASLGMRPRDFVRELAPVAAGFGAVLAILATSWGVLAADPARIARDVLADGERACRSKVASTGAPVVVEVPLLEATWACFPNHEPRVIVWPSGGQAMAIAGASADLDLAHGAVTLEDAEIVAWSDPSEPIRARAGRLALRGLDWPLLRGSNLGPLTRGVVLVFAMIAATLTALAVVVVGAASSRASALLVGAGGPAVGALVFSSLEASPNGIGAYITVGAASVAPAAIAWIGFLGRKRWVRSLRGRMDGGSS